MSDKLKIETSELRKHIGKRVRYITNRDAESTIFYKGHIGILTEIYRKQIDFGNSDWIPFSKIKSITLENK